MPNGSRMLDIATPPADQSSSHPGREGNGRVVGWLQSPFTFAALCMLGALPLVFAAMPPLIDLGGHLGRYAVQLDGGASATLRQWYSFHWSLIPNLGVDLLMQVLAPWLGLERALKLIVVAIPVLQIAGWLLLARAVHGHVTPLALFALPLAYGYPFQYGFVNFTLCAALATCFLALWLKLANRDGADGKGLVLRWLVFVPLSCVLWVTHLAGWAMFCVFAGADELWRLYLKRLENSPGQNLRRDAFRSMVLLSCLFAPWALKLLWPAASTGQGETDDFFNIGHKFPHLVMALRDRWAFWDIASVLVIYAVIGWSCKSRRFAWSGGLALGTAGLALLFLILPGQILGSAFADMRLVPTMLAMALIAARPRLDSPRRFLNGLAIVGLIFAGARLAGNAVSMAVLDRQFSNDLSALAAVPSDTQLVSLATEPCHPVWWPWNRDRRGHLGGYAIARGHDFSNDQWNIPGGQLLHIHNPDAGVFSSDPSEIVKHGVCRGKPGLVQVAERIPRAIRFLWILDDGQRRSIPGWQPIGFSPGSVVYSRQR